jgi:hypothetical protein
MEKKYILILVHLDKNKVDIAGNKYNGVGDVIEAKEFTKDKDIRYGIYGVPWGKTHYFLYDRLIDGFWAVIKTENNDNFIPVDKYYNTVKVKSGLILHIGTIESAAQFIINAKNDKTQLFLKEAKKIKEEEIAGSPSWLAKHDNEGILFI